MRRFVEHVLMLPWVPIIYAWAAYVRVREWCTGETWTPDGWTRD